jgi:hypothetical protein
LKGREKKPQHSPTQPRQSSPREGKQSKWNSGDIQLSNRKMMRECPLLHTESFNLQTTHYKYITKQNTNPPCHRREELKKVEGNK